MFDVLQELNWLAIILAAVAYFMLGALWFTPLFGKAYDTALGVKRGKDQKWPAIYYVGPFISALVSAAASAVLLHAMNIQNIADALWFGIIVGVGYALSISVNNAINPVTPRPILYGFVTGGYHIVGLTIVGAILFAME